VDKNNSFELRRLFWAARKQALVMCVATRFDLHAGLLQSFREELKAFSSFPLPTKTIGPVVQSITMVRDFFVLPMLTSSFASTFKRFS